MSAAPNRRDAVLGNVRVPIALVSDCEKFGGRPDRDCLAGNLVIRDGKVAGLTDAPAGIDLGGRLVTPPLVEAHCHLDKCFTVDRLDFGGGTLADAIAAQGRDKNNWTAGDLRARAERGLREFEAAGTRIVRTHVDWDFDPTDPTREPIAWRVIGELAEEWRKRIVVQRAALLPIDAMADDAVCDAVASVIAAGGGVLGAFVFDQPDRRAGIRSTIRAAAQHGLPLDFHVDEGLSPDLDGIDIIAQEVLAARHNGAVLCGHACSLVSLDGETRKRRIDLVAEAGLSVVALPTSNLYLQDRGQGAPRQRGLTTIGELTERGVNTVIGTDNVQDAFCPVGAHNPAQSLCAAVLAAQLEPPLANWLPAIMGRAASALGLDLAPVDRSAAADLLIWDTRSVAGLISANHRIAWQPLATCDATCFERRESQTQCGFS